MSGPQPTGSPAKGNPDALLSRELGVRSFAANIFNYTVGSGIFSLPAFAVIGLGSAAPLAYIACAIVIGLVVLCFAESGSRVSSTGGAYAYVETALEDNEMKARSVADQERIARTMERLGMQMGVFVAHQISWNEAGVASGDTGTSYSL